MLVGLADDVRFGDQIVGSDHDPVHAQVLLGRDQESSVGECVLHAELDGLLDAVLRRGCHFECGHLQRIVGIRVAENHDLDRWIDHPDQLVHAAGNVAHDDRTDVSETLADRGFNRTDAYAVVVLETDLLVDVTIGDIGNHEIAGERGGRNARNQSGHNECGQGILLHG